MKKKGEKKRAMAAATPLLGKDEMNLTEFPYASLAHAVPEDCNQLIFEDEIFDQSTREVIHRKLTITGDAELGLPNSLDDDVLMVLMLITKQRDPSFKSRTVPYSRMEVIEMLGWPINGQSVDRLEEALTRWHGVKLDWERAWWDKKTGTWRNEKFHVLDNISDFDLEPLRRSKVNLDQATLPFCSFTWNEVLFNSFKAGYLKSIDLGFYFQLSSAISKRAYRFLDKHFYRESEISMDLRTFACNKIGLSKAYSPTKMKEKLQPALNELEDFGFLEPLSKEKRYEKVSHGVWKIMFTRGELKPAIEEGEMPAPALPLPVAAAAPLADPAMPELVSRGVTATIAAKLVKKHGEEAVRKQLDILDGLPKKKREKIDDEAAYLVKAISDDWKAPKGHVPREERERQAAASAKRLADKQAEDRRKWEAEQQERQVAEQVKTYRQSRTPEQLAQLEADAIAAASEETRQSLDIPAMKRFRETRIFGLVREHIAHLIETGQLVVEPA
jgi:Replication initiator protein A